VQAMTFIIVKELYGLAKTNIVLARDLDYTQGEIGLAWKKLYRNKLDQNTKKINDFLLGIKTYIN
jgi:hypothetical protein